MPTGCSPLTLTLLQYLSLLHVLYIEYVFAAYKINYCLQPIIDSKKSAAVATGVGSYNSFEVRRSK